MRVWITWGLQKENNWQKHKEQIKMDQTNLIKIEKKLLKYKEQKIIMGKHIMNIEKAAQN